MFLLVFIYDFNWSIQKHSGSRVWTLLVTHDSFRGVSGSLSNNSRLSGAFIRKPKLSDGQIETLTPLWTSFAMNETDFTSSTLRSKYKVYILECPNLLQSLSNVFIEQTMAL